MNKLLGFFKNLFGKWKAISKKKKIAIIIIAVGILAALTMLIVSKTTTKYAVLFSKLDSTDAATIISKLDEKKVSHQENSSTGTIYVPKDQADKLKLELASSVKNGSQGFELFDNSSSKFGTTDAEFNVEYQRALQGELERIIKTLDGIDDARVTLVMPKDSVFVKDSTKATASVTIKMKPGADTLTKDKVLSIISIVSGSVSNLPKENVQVIDDKMNLLSKDVIKDNSDSSTTASDRSKVEKEREAYYEKQALDVLESAYGKGKVKVKVNVALNFDAVESNSESYYSNPTDPKDTRNPVVVSENNTNNSSTGTSGSSGSPTNNNNTTSTTNSNTITNGGNSSSTSTTSTKNYDVSSDKTKTVKSPGDVKRLTIAVLVNGNVDANTQDKISNIVGNAVGYDTKRGDSISVEGMSFDNSAQKAAQKALDDMKAEEQAAKNQKMYTIIGIVSAVIIAALIVLGVRLIKKRRAAKLLAAEEAEDEEDTQNIDVLVDDEGTKETKQKFAPIDFERNDENTHVENEIKKYATTKPDQVVDIIKAWLANDER